MSHHGHGSGIASAAKAHRILRFVLVGSPNCGKTTLFNDSAIENVVVLASDYHFSMLAKNAKDMAAGAVLVISGFAVITGLIIFVPKIWDWIF